MSVSAFPKHKSLEKFIRQLDEQGAQLISVSENLKLEIDKWHEAYVRLGKEYIEAGGNNIEILDKIFEVVKAKEIFGAYIV